MENPIKTYLKENLPLLGHRNWIVITDMAYPQQSAPGIDTLYTEASFEETLADGKQLIEDMPHVFAHIYHDREFDVITETLVPGIDRIRQAVNEICGSQAQAMKHEDLIKRLDEASKLYRIVIIKTPLTIPYTSQFLELDCGYWDAERQQQLDELMKA